MSDESNEGVLKLKPREELQEWLEGLPPAKKPSVAAAITARVVLRGLPYLASSRWTGSTFERHVSDGALQAFLAGAVAWTVTRFPGVSWSLQLLRETLNATTPVELENENPTVQNFLGAANGALVAVCLAAGGVVPAIPFYSVIIGSAYFQSGSEDFQAALWNDVSFINSGGATELLASTPLWPNGTPEEMNRHWAFLREAFPRQEYWQVWIDWYNRRLGGKSDPEEVELIFATVPEAERKAGPAAANKWIRERLEELQRQQTPPPPEAPAPTWDFFISYSTHDESAAREVAAVLEQAGHSTFAQFKDMAPGNNFVREMQSGLGGAGRMIALYSPEYEKSDHCQTEWSAAYNSDPSGKQRKLIPLLLRPTNLNSLARQIVYKSLVGLAGEARKKAILDSIAPKPSPQPLENLPSPFTFAQNAADQITVVAGPQNTPVIAHPGDDATHLRWLKHARKLSERLIADLKARNFNVRPGYLECLEHYLVDLPTEPGAGDFLMADAEVRTLCNLFAAEPHLLPEDFAARLDTMLKSHFSLLGFYPEVERYLAAARQGQLSAPLPLDAIEGFGDVVRRNTPQAFAPEVSRGLEEVEREPPKVELELEDIRAGKPPIEPSVHPLATPDPEKSYAFGVMSVHNALYIAVLTALKTARDEPSKIVHWIAIEELLRPHAAQIIEWLRDFVPPAH